MGRGQTGLWIQIELQSWLEIKLGDRHRLSCCSRAIKYIMQNDKNYKFVQVCLLLNPCNLDQ